MIDISPFDEADPVHNAKALIAELEKYDPELAQKPRWLVLNKLDLVPENERSKTGKGSCQKAEIQRSCL